jgi:hypothetical protein
MREQNENKLPLHLARKLFESVPTCQKVLDERIYRYPSYSHGFLKKWRSTPEALASEQLAVKACSFVVWEDFRFTDGRTILCSFFQPRIDTMDWSH